MSKTFSCDLVSNAKKHRQFLIDMHSFNMSTFIPSNDDPSNCTKTVEQRSPSAKEVEALRRYQHLWLPLVADTVISNIPLIPPPDIAWLWHCHRLAPHQYSQYCQQTFHRGDNKTIEAYPPFVFTSPEHIDDDDDVVNTTKQLWKDTYPNESFFLSSNTQDGKHSISDVHPLIGGFDLVGSARRQATFLWQVSGEPYTSDSFLESGRDNYEKFLKLTIPAKQLNIILVPTYQIDLMWHTHMLSSIEDYNNDCIRLVNSTMYHDDSIDDREDGGILDVSYAATEKLWVSVYNTEYNVKGGMYRGEPPSEFFTQSWSRPIADMSALPINDKLIDMVGTLSTTSKILSTPKQWVKLNETASDGRAAFIQTRFLYPTCLCAEKKRKEMMALPHLDYYVLGRRWCKTGYFHIETLESHYILYYRIKNRLTTMRSEMMADLCTFGLLTSKTKKEARREKVKNLAMVCEKVRAQIFSPNFNSVNKMAPDVLFDCAGGSCGGKVALKMQGKFDSLTINEFMLHLYFPYILSVYFSCGMWCFSASSFTQW